MPIQILPREEGIAEKLGRGLGTGLGTGLQSLAQQKLQDMNIQQQAPGLAKLLNITPQEAVSLLRQPTGIQSAFAKEQVAAPRYAAESQKYEELLKSVTGGREREQPSEISQQGGRQAGISSQAARDLAKIEIDLAQQKRKESIAKSQELHKWIEPYAKRSQTATKLQKSYSNMAKAASSGNLTAGGVYRYAKALGFGDLATNTPSQIFDKMANEIKTDLIKKDLPPGSRANIFIERIISGKIPGREQDPEAIRALSEVGTRAQQMDENEGRIAREVAKEIEGKSILPWERDFLVQERTDKENKRLAEEIEFILGNVLEDKPYVDPQKAMNGMIPQGTEINSIEDIKEIPEGRRVFSTELGRDLTMEELMEMGYGR